MNASTKTIATLDVAVIGAGLCGIFALYELRKQGLRVRAFETGADVSGTWYWNRYPGLRIDIEGMDYSYPIPEVEQGWSWSERYASQDELRRYFNFVVDTLDMRADIQLNSRIESFQFDEQAAHWVLSSANGETVHARYVVMATGLLAVANRHLFKGMADFRGLQLHSADWPEDGVDFTGKRVAVIGTGSSGVQIVPVVAQQARHLHVFQRTPGYIVPLRNEPMKPEYEAYVKSIYPKWREAQRHGSLGGWTALNYDIAPLLTQSALEVSAEERRAAYEERYANGGLAMYGIYPDIYTNIEANDTLADFLREKMRARVRNPKVAEKLMPRFPVFTKRLMGDNGYLEAFDRDNVTLVDISGSGIECLTPQGIRVGGVEYEFDIIIYATGYDALSGAMMHQRITGRGGETIQQHWDGGVRSRFGMLSRGFPNMFMLCGPGSTIPLFLPYFLAEEQLEWIGNCIAHMAKTGKRCIEPTAEAEDDWGAQCNDTLNMTLFPRTGSWYVGTNVPGKPRTGLAYFGGMPNYRRQLAESAAAGYRDFELG